MTKPKEPTTEFGRWRAALGLDGKQVRQAGELIGYRESVSSQLNRGKRGLTERDRLAMAAVRAGLKPWTPYNDHEPAAVHTVLQLMKGWPR